MLDGAADLDQLLARRAELPDAPLRLQREMVLLDQARGALGSCGGGSPSPSGYAPRGPGRCSPPPRGAAPAAIPGAPWRSRSERLRPGCETARPCRASVFAGIRREHARHDLHQRGLARAVLAQQQVDLSGLHAQVTALERGYAAEALFQIAKFEKHAEWVEVGGGESVCPKRSVYCGVGKRAARRAKAEAGKQTKTNPPPVPKSCPVR